MSPTLPCPHCGRPMVCGRCGTADNVQQLQWASGDTTLICKSCLDGLEQVVQFYMDRSPDLNRVDADVPDFPPPSPKDPR